MIRAFLAFFVIFAIVTFSITAFRALTGKEKWQFTKILAYGIILSMVTATILAAIVIIF